MNLQELFESEELYGEFVDAVKEECDEMIYACHMAKAPIFRGIKDGIQFPQFKKIRQDRFPIQMSEWKHELINKALSELGHIAHRGNSIFCTSDPKIAEDWGDLCYVIVKDGWSATVFDKKKRGYAFDNLKNVGGMNDQEKYDNIMEALLDMDPRTIKDPEELAAVIKAGYQDILITGTEYAVIPARMKSVYKRIVV